MVLVSDVINVSSDVINDGPDKAELVMVALKGKHLNNHGREPHSGRTCFLCLKTPSLLRQVSVRTKLFQVL